MHDIFLSYSTKDRERLVPLVAALEQQGWSVFWDHRSVPIGDKWREVIEEAVCECRCVLVVWSEESVKSKWVKEEASEGSRRDVLLPIRVDDVLPPFGFREDQAGNFIGWDGTTDYPEFIRLTDRIRSLLKEQAKREAAETAEQERLAQEKAVAERQVREAAEQQRRLAEEARHRREVAETAEREQLAKEKAAAEQKARDDAERQRWLDESQARLAAEEAAKQKKLEQERAAEQKAREEAERQAKAKQERLNREKEAAAEKVRKEVERQSKVNSDLSAKKFPWLPALFISAAVFGGGGYYWKSSVGASPAGDSSLVQEKVNKSGESLAEQAPTAAPQSNVVEKIPILSPPPEPTPAEQLQQAETWLNGDDNTQWTPAIKELKILATTKNTASAAACYFLGGIYYNGYKGVKANIAEGCEWYKKAENAGHIQARETYERLKCK